MGLLRVTHAVPVALSLALQAAEEARMEELRARMNTDEFVYESHVRTHAWQSWKSKQPVPKAANASTVASAAPVDTAAVCKLCKRKFSDAAALSTHVSSSELHRKNVLAAARVEAVDI